MPKLAHALRAWPSDAFGRALKSELERLGADRLPLDQGVCHGGRVADDPIAVSVLRVADEAAEIVADVGVFFGEIIAGCSCGDDPQMRHAYCELRVRIDKTTAAAAFAPIPD